MSSARDKFYQTIEAITSLSAATLLVDVFPPNAAHNERARILRSGLVVAAYSHLETYFQDRLDEAITIMPSSKIQYSYFGNKLKQFLCVDSVRGLSRQMKYLSAPEALLLAERNLPKLSSFSGNPPVFTGLGFNTSGSNVSSSDIGRLLGAFGVKNPWAAMSALCGKIGNARGALKQDFENLSKMRNACAHDSNSNVPTADLVAHVQTAVLVGLATDLIVTHAIDCFVKSRSMAVAEGKANSMPLKLRFVDQSTKGAWRESAPTTKRARKIYATLPAAQLAPKKSNTSYIVRDIRLFPLAIF